MTVSVRSGRSIIMKFAVDLLWVRPGKVGGTEYYIRNLLNGFMQLKYDFEIVLILALNNAAAFDKYFSDARFIKILCDVDSNNVGKRIIWQNAHLNKLLEREGIDVCLEPVYSKPLFDSKEVNFITTIHDLQALHYPEYQNKLKVQCLKIAWKQTVRTSHKIIAISDFVKKDIINNYKVSTNNILTIHNAIDCDANEVLEFEKVQERFHIQANEYYYTVSSMEPHKNMETLFKVMGYIKKRGIDLPSKWLLTGVNERARDKVFSMAEKYNISDRIVMTSYVENNIRNTLSKYCTAFLYPSIFEGFGMPPVEAMAFGANVITTKKASLYEVTQGKANYIENPYNIEEWVKAMVNLKPSTEKIDMSWYEPKNIAEQYWHCLFAAYNKKRK